MRQPYYIVWPIIGNTNVDPGVTLFAVKASKALTPLQLGDLTQIIQSALNTSPIALDIAYTITE